MKRVSIGHRGLTIRIKRAYDTPLETDGGRVLVDRVWPRGLSKQQLRIDAWLGDLGPSTALRKWFGHDPRHWDEFRRRYRRELADKPLLLQELLGYARKRTLTLVYSARDTTRNQAVVIKEVVEAAGSTGRSVVAGQGASGGSQKRWRST